MAQNTDSEEARSFLDSLWKGKPLSAAVQIWEKATGLNSTFSSLAQAATYATDVANRGDVYMATGLALRQVRPARTRATAAQVVGVPGVWADIDVNGGPEMKTGAAPTLAAAEELACELLEPTLLVASGYGLQAWWLFDEPWIFDADGVQRERARQLVKAFQLALRAKAKERGFGLDSTHDLARLMRLPGTRNHKGGGDPVAVRLLEHEGPTYEPEALHGSAAAFMKEAATLGGELAGTGIEVHVNGKPPDPPWPRIMELTQIDPEFGFVWQRTKRPGDGSASAFDLSIATRLVNAGFTDQEIAESIRWQRAKYDPESGKGDRVDYLQKTIARARRGTRVEQQRLEAEAERNEAIEQLGVIADQAGDGEVEPSLIIGLFQRIYGGPQIKQLIQDGADYETGRLKLMLADGRDVPLGPMRGLLDQKEFTARFAAVTQYIPSKEIRATKDQPVGWQQLIAGLMKAAEVIEETEDTRVRLITGWVQLYIAPHRGNERDLACEQADPFIENGDVHVCLPSLHQWLRKAQGERRDRADLRQLLKDGGFTHGRVNYRRSDGVRSKRDYWHAPTDQLDDVDKEATE